MTKFYALLIVVLSFNCFSAVAQNSSGLFFNNHFTPQASKYAPSRLGDDNTYNQWYITLPSINVFGNNNAASMNDIYSGIIDRDITRTEVNDLVDGLPDINRVGGGIHGTYFGLAYKLLRKTDFENERYPSEVMTFSLDMSERIEGNSTLPKELAELAWYGNARFIGQTIDLNDVEANAFQQREIALGWSMPVVNREDLKLRVGARVKYIIGVYNAQLKNNSAALTFSSDTTTVNFDADFELNLALLDSLNEFDDFDNFQYDPFKDFMKGRGTGIGVDIGASVVYNENWTATLSLLDIGYVKYKTDVKNLKFDHSADFEGFEFEFNDSNDWDNFLDSLENEYAVVESNESYNTPLPTRASLQLGYRIMGKDRMYMPYAKHSFYVSYVQGFRNYGVASLRPDVNLGYAFSHDNLINLGASVGYGGYTDFKFGAFVSAKVGNHFVVGVGSENISGILAKSLKSGGSFNFNLGLTF